MLVLKELELTGTCRDKGGINKELLKLKKEDKRDVIP
jgi:hypothetical protein